VGLGRFRLSSRHCRANPDFGASLILARHLQTYLSSSDKFEGEEKMNYFLKKLVLTLPGLILILSFLCVPTLAQKKGKMPNEATRRSKDAATVFDQIMGAPDSAIPKELVDKAQAIAVFPGVLKAAFIFGGTEGKGVISRRTAQGWSTPAFFNLGGGSFGAQIGADKTDYILLVMNDEGLNGLLGDKFAIGGEVGVAAGPVGRTASAATDAQLKAEILTYSRSKGLFAGVDLNGSAITPDNNLNEAVYGMKAKDILSGAGGSVPAGISMFPETLARY
jgi:lipid-binding SYLF domain-containing protein